MVSRPPPRRSRRPMGLPGLLVGLLLLFCLVGAAGLGAYNLQAVYRASGPAQQAAEAFLRAVAAGDRAGAYQMLCPDTRARLSRDDFTQRMAALPRITAYEVRDVSVATNKTELKGTAMVELAWETGVRESRDLSLVTVDGTWRTCGEPF